MFSSQLRVWRKRSSSGRYMRVAERAVAAAEDRDLVDRVGLGQAPRDQGVAGLVVGDPQLLVAAEDALALLGAGDHALDALLELDAADLGLAPCGPRAGRPR